MNHFNHVEATESGDYYQVIFKGKKDDEEIYFLIQRQIEFTDDGECYIESDELIDVGHFIITYAEMSQSRLQIKIENPKPKSFNIKFQTDPDNFKEVKKIMKIMMPNIKIIK